MLKNYFKIAWRSLWRHKIFSLINILGLSAGISFTLLIGAFVWGDLQVNKQLKDDDNQYVILSKWKDPNMGNELAGVAQLPRALKDNYPNLVANYYKGAPALTNLSRGDKHFREHLQVGDSTLLNLYGFKLMYGDARTALKDPFSIVITPEMANKYFDRTDVIGQMLSIENFNGGKHDYIVTGVLAPLPINTITGLNGDDKFQFFVNGNLNKSLRDIEGWDNTGTVDYIQLRKGVDPKAVEKVMMSLLKKSEAPDEIKANLTPYLVPLKDYYLQGNNSMVKKMMWTLSCIAFFILSMAIINFVNICIGRSGGRMKEMGLRKVMGGMRKQLIGQFLTESVLMVMLAITIALCIYPIARQYFSNALGREVMGLMDFPIYFVLIPFAFALFVGLLAGIYPALVLSSLGTIDSLKGKQSSIKENILFPKLLIGFQFATAAIVIICAIIISQQISLFFNGDLGYNKDYVVYAQVPRDWSSRGVKKMEAIRYQLAQLPQVSSVSLSWEIPDGLDWEMRKTAVYKEGTNPSHSFNTQHLIADNQYAATFSIPLKAGKFFNPVALAADSSETVINETELKALGWNDPDDAIGQKIVFQGNTLTICGVTADFHFGTMQQRIQPITFTSVNYYNIYRYLSFKVKPGNVSSNLAAIQNKWAELMPGAPFEHNFMDDALTKLYSTEIQLKKTAYIATTLAVIIVLLGVLGLISLSIQKRTKEIGIRKVLGSSVVSITMLFLKDFLNIVLIASFIACPLAYLIMQRWLNDYAYKINISLSPFVFSITLLTAITALLIILQTIKAAFRNPVKSLKTE